MTMGLLARMYFLQVHSYEHFRTLSEENRVSIVPLPPSRGLIFDRNGVVLAQNMPSFSIEVIPEAVDDLSTLVERLRGVLDITEADEERFRVAVRKSRRFESVPLRFRLDPKEVARFAVNRHLFPGVDVHARPARDYPLGPVAAHLIGYVGRISEQDLRQIDPVNYRASTHIGKTGVEQAFEESLHGRVGYQHVESNAFGRTLRVLDRIEPTPGRNLFLTIDVSLQSVAEQALGERNGAVVAIEPATGRVLALASVPNFDPNLFVNGIDHETYRALLGSESRPLFNRALNGQYPPGSTIKPFVGLAGLELGEEVASKKVWCPGFFSLPGHSHRYRDWKRGGHGRMDVHDAIVESCDVFFYELAFALGVDRMHDYMAQFGFGDRTGIALAGESEGLLPSSKWKRRVRGKPWYPGETLITGIGQGFSLSTPLQLAVATATLAARGARLRPQVVGREIDPGSGDVTEHAPQVMQQVTPREPEHWTRVIDAMVDVVHGKKGTARKISPGMTYEMAGKTGTAQVFGLGQDEEYEEEKIDASLRDHGLFVGFAPADAPRLAVAVVVENGGGGSRSAAPVARVVLDHYLQELDIPETNRPMLTAELRRPRAVAGAR
ncbi:MAG: penicillin-binding protein 2 [Chromatiales bacterium]|nr:penicillin-binding protein 2 [Chromatiales bacterium]